ncbi:hypothetical protein OESDEN_02097 [Oesophagostomum dentatum]|uniref:Uncharacterized protein n=1 Tax=Oesophagostomum dentatum TaxID=61180 RepID=A0A0B1TP77_OESDE|nr:hypothetical protein OESDEN_02097 [Oesophagostomum dentatum]
MRRFVLVVLAALCSAELSEDQLVKYGSEVFNDCTQCNIMNAAREQPEILQQVNRTNNGDSGYLGGS